MLDNHLAFMARNIDEVAICGIYIPKRDSIHVALSWRINGRSEIVEFMNGRQILVRDAAIKDFEQYYFNKLSSFPNYLIPALAAVAKAIATNKLNDFELKINSAVYAGGEFEYVNGSFKPEKSAAERYINCGVFVLALLKSYKIIILDWSSFPNSSPANRQYLEDWLNNNKIFESDKAAYYNQNKEIRGKHILVCPSTPTTPTPYTEALQFSYRLIRFMRNEMIIRLLSNSTFIKRVRLVPIKRKNSPLI